MGVTLFSIVTPYTIMMGMLWFSVFVLVGLMLRKLKYPIMFSTVPLVLILVVSIFRMLIIVGLPNPIIINSRVIYPWLVRILVHEVLPFRILGIMPLRIFTILLCIWIFRAMYMLVRYVRQYLHSRNMVESIFSSYPRCHDSEAVLKGFIGSDNEVSVFRMPCISVPASAGSKPYIFLPGIDFSLDELQVVLLHEWKHHQDKDAITRVVVEIICIVFWWNPLVKVLRKNVEFALELKCDYYAMTSIHDHESFINVIERLRKPHLTKWSRDNHDSDIATSVDALGGCHTPGFSMLITGKDELKDRYSMQAMRNYHSVRRRRLVNVLFTVAATTLFVASYVFLILPIFWIDTDVPMVVVSDCITDHYKYDSVFIPGEVFIIANDDNTYSLYIEGEFVKYVDMAEEFTRYIPVLQRDVY